MSGDAACEAKLFVADAADQHRRGPDSQSCVWAKPIVMCSHAKCCDCAPVAEAQRPFSSVPMTVRWRQKPRGPVWLRTCRGDDGKRLAASWSCRAKPNKGVWGGVGGLSTQAGVGSHKRRTETKLEKSKSRKVFDFSDFLALFELFGLFDFSVFLALFGFFGLFDFSTFRVFWLFLDFFGFSAF